MGMAIGMSYVLWHVTYLGDVFRHSGSQLHETPRPEADMATLAPILLSPAPPAWNTKKELAENHSTQTAWKPT